MNSIKIAYDEAWNTEANKYTQEVKNLYHSSKLHIFRSYSS